MTVFIGIVVGVVVIWLISLLFEWISDHKEAVLGVIGLIAAVVVLVFFMPKIWPFISSGLQSALQNWPFLLILLACFGLYKRAKRKKVREFVIWMDRVGIAKKSEAPANQSILKLAFKEHSVTILIPGLIFSTEFYSKVAHWLDQPVAVSKELFQNCCLHFAPDFRSDYTEVLLSHFADKDKLLPLLSSDSLSGSKRLYLSSQLKDSYITLFKQEGAATEDEFTRVCDNFDTGSGISPNPRVVAVTILNYLVSQGTTDKIDLEDHGDPLFVYKLPNKDTKLVRREISLDD